MKEVELKFAIAHREDVKRLIQAFGEPQTTWEQVNHYFLGDAKGCLDRGEALLRLREFAGRAVLAFKTDLVREGALFQCEETEVELDPSTASALLAGEVNPLALENPASKRAREALGEGFPRVGGYSITQRTQIPLESGEVLEIDHSRFPGGVEDFEIEVETSDPTTTASFLRGVAGRMGIVLRPQTKTKLRRFLDALS
ncbi:MAG: CYTH domain-containing protein [Planctomycetota bacterium]|jgi:uncharacterized protein YjbK